MGKAALPLAAVLVAAALSDAAPAARAQGQDAGSIVTFSLPQASAGRDSVDPASGAPSGSIVTFPAGEPTLRTPPTVLPPAGQRKVRVVGPKFLPDRPAAAARPAPDPTPAR